MSNSQFAHILTRMRLRAGITQEQLADLSTLSSRAIRNLEKGHVKHPRKETVHLLADALRADTSTRRALMELARDSEQETVRSGSAETLSWLVESPRWPMTQTGCAHYEYKTVPLSQGGPYGDSGTDVLNREAWHGWRLAAVDAGTAFLERVRLEGDEGSLLNRSAPWER